MVLAFIVLLFLGFFSWLSCVYVDYKDKNPIIFLWMLLIIFVYLPLYVNYNLGYIELPTVNIILFFAFMSCVTYFLSNIFFRGIMGNGILRLERRIDFIDPGSKPIYVLYLGSFLVYIIFIFNGIGYSELMSASFLTKREIGIGSLLILIISAITLAQSYFIFKTKNIIHILYYFIFFGIIIAFYKSRSIIILGLLPLMYYMFFWNRNKKLLLLSILFAPIILLTTQMLRALRYQGSLVNFDFNKLILDTSSNLKLLFLEGDFAVINVFFNIIRDCHNVNWCGDFTLLKSLAGLLTSLSGVKTLEYYLYDYYVNPGLNGSLHPTLFGFLYGDFGGYFGFLFFIFLGFISACISKYFLTSRFFFLFNGFVMYFVLFMARGSVYNSLIFIILAFVILFLITNIKLIKVRN